MKCFTKKKPDVYLYNEIKMSILKKKKEYFWFEYFYLWVGFCHFTNENDYYYSVKYICVS